MFATSLDSAFGISRSLFEHGWSCFSARRRCVEFDGLEHDEGEVARLGVDFRR